MAQQSPENVGETPFVGRGDEVTRIVSAVLEGRSVLIYGERRMGKTTLLRKLGETLEDRGVVAVHVTPEQIAAGSIPDAHPRARRVILVDQPVVPLAPAEQVALGEGLRRCASPFVLGTDDPALANRVRLPPDTLHVRLGALEPKDAVDFFVRSGLGAIPSPVLEEIARAVNGHPFLLRRVAERLLVRVANGTLNLRSLLEATRRRNLAVHRFDNQSAEDAESALADLRSLALDLAFGDDGDGLVLKSVAELFPLVRDEAARIWLALTRSSVVQLQEGAPSPVMLALLAALAMEDGYRVGSNETVPGAGPRAGSPSDVLARGLDPEGRAGLAELRAAVGQNAHPHNVWGRMDRLAGDLATTTDLFTARRLLIIRPGAVPSVVEDILPNGWSPTAELAEVVEALLCRRGPDYRLRILLVSSDPLLRTHLPQHLTRPHGAYAFPALAQTSGRGVPRWSAASAAIGQATGGVQALQALVTEHVGVTSEVPPSGPPRWASGLRSLRVTNLLDLGGPAWAPDEALAREAAAREVTEAADVKGLLAKVASANLADSPGMRASGSDSRGPRLATLLGPEAGSEGQTAADLAGGFVAAWLVDLAEGAASPRPDQLEPPGQPRTGRTKALMASFDEAWAQWSGLARDLAEAGLLGAVGADMGLQRAPMGEEVAAVLFAIEVTTPAESRVRWFGMSACGPERPPEAPAPAPEAADLPARVSPPYSCQKSGTPSENGIEPG